MPVRVLLEMFESMGRIWAQMLIDMNHFHVCPCGLFLGCSIMLFVLTIPILEYYRSRWLTFCRSCRK